MIKDKNAGISSHAQPTSEEVLAEDARIAAVVAEVIGRNKERDRRERELKAPAMNIHPTFAP